MPNYIKNEKGYEKGVSFDVKAVKAAYKRPKRMKSKSKGKWPDARTLKRIRTKLSKGDAPRLLPPDASPLDKAKFDVCEQLIVFKRKKQISSRELAALLEVPETRVSEIMHYRIEKFTLDRLVEYLQRVKPRMSLRVA